VLRDVAILDGALGTELQARGVALDLPLWSGAAIEGAPDVLARLHSDYAAAGATIHTAGTFRTRPRQAGADWERLARRAVAIARGAVPAHHRVAGSIGPLEDCYRPDLSPPHPGPEHAALARVLADAGVDLLLCETFPHVREGLAAVEAAVATGVETWASFTAGPHADLLTPGEVGRAAREAAERGARAVLVNCVPASRTLVYVEALADAGVPFGAYANAGAPGEGFGWQAGPEGPARYLAAAQTWVAAGATLVGGCCGTGPAHVARLAAAFATLPPGRPR
jgi:S-methylmethionine-dependent homocysteine/selenocysteine methylase